MFTQQVEKVAQITGQALEIEKPSTHEFASETRVRLMTTFCHDHLWPKTMHRVNLGERMVKD